MFQTFFLFNIAFSYTDLDAQGKNIKQKKQVKVSAVNYTDAEQIALNIIPDLQTHSNEVDYVINRLSKRPTFILTPSIEVNDKLTLGLFNYYLQGDETETNLYQVFVEFDDINEKGNPKVSKEEFLLAAKTNREAYDMVLNYIQQVDVRSFAIKDVKFDKSDELFVSEQEHKNHVYESETYSIL